MPIIDNTQLIIDAENDDPRSQTRLGYKYQEGYGGIKKDYEQAIFWYRKAASHNYPAAQYNLAALYYDYSVNSYRTERGYVEDDYQQAINWAIKAANNNYIRAQIFLGDMYRDEKKFTESFYWYQKAAELGDEETQIMLGDMKLNGYYTEQNFEQALHWYQRAAEQGNADAAVKLADLITRPLSSQEKRIGKFIIQHGIATDTSTNLTWLRFSYGQSWVNNNIHGSINLISYYDAIRLPDFFNSKGGYLNILDWRLPDASELITLVDNIRGMPSHYIDTEIFPNSHDDYWIYSKHEMCFSFSEGKEMESLSGNFPRAVRLVRGKKNK